MVRSKTDDLIRELLKTFQVEAAEHVQALTQSLLKLERGPEEKQGKQLLQDAFRAAHSLKGAARAVDLKEIESLAHAMENILQQARDNGMILNAGTCDVLYDSVDAIDQLLDGQPVDVAQLLGRLDALNGHQNSTASPQPEPVIEDASASIVAGEETIRVSVNKLDDLMAEVGELLVHKISAEQRQTDLQGLQQLFQGWFKSWREVTTQAAQLNGNKGHPLSEALAGHAKQMQTLMQAFNGLSQSINGDTVRLGMTTTNLQDKVRQVRMIPFQTLALGLERAVRDASHTQDKQVIFHIEGGDTELDKKVLEILKDPLMHLLRNAVDHGIEGPETRQEAGKPAAGQVTLALEQRGSEVRITVRDDGRGFDLDALRQVGDRENAISENGSADDLINLAFQPGVTTATEVTALSGRGVGLDVVRKQLESIHGRISVDNISGQGVSIELIVPTSMAITRGLMVRVGKERYAIPLLSIEKIVEPTGIFSVGGKAMLTVDDKPLPLVHLRSLLERALPDDEPANDPLAIIMGIADQRLALLVDDVLTEQELAVKPLGNPLKRVRNVTGAALMGNGQPVLVLNPGDLVKSLHRAKNLLLPLTAETGPRPEIRVRILVVDDSITTRTLEKNILEAAGFEVTTAIDGIEALKRLDEETIDLVVSDIQMPNMDGFVLTQHLRESSKYYALPIILVTSLESREDRERGMLAGADAYIVKRGFDQAELLTTIQQHL